MGTTEDRNDVIKALHAARQEEKRVALEQATYRGKAMADDLVRLWNFHGWDDNAQIKESSTTIRTLRERAAAERKTYQRTKRLDVLARVTEAEAYITRLLDLMRPLVNGEE